MSFKLTCGPRVFSLVWAIGYVLPYPPAIHRVLNLILTRVSHQVWTMKPGWLLTQSTWTKNIRHIYCFRSSRDSAGLLLIRNIVTKFTFIFLQYRPFLYKVTGSLLESAFISVLDLILFCKSLGRLAQLVEQLTLNQQVEGSSPSSLIQKSRLGCAGTALL